VSGRQADYKQILRLRSEGVSGRAIADVLGYSRNTVQAVLGAADAEQIAWQDVAGWDAAGDIVESCGLMVWGGCAFPDN
jgi:orotate phosphoribosyltransferase-like protein